MSMMEVNLDRRYVMNELFEEHFEIDTNILKIVSLHNFDDYLIEQMKNMKKR